MPRLTEATKRARRESIVSAAFQCFAEKGLAGTSMADIIEAAGLSAGSIYSHFESKTEIIRLVASEVLGESQEILSEAAGQGRAQPPGDLIMRVFTRFTGRDRARVLLQVWSEVVQDPTLVVHIQDFFARAHDVLYPPLEAWIRQEFGLDGEALADAVRRAFDHTIAATHGCIVRLAIDSLIDPEVFTREIADSLNRMRFA